MRKYELDRFAVPAGLYVRQAEKIRCSACAHGCFVPDGGRGLCGARFNEGGVLYAPHGYVTALAADPVEKKPFYHFYPGAVAMSFGMAGCNFSCRFCQNYGISQCFRDETFAFDIRTITAREIVNSAVSAGARIVVSTYNEPFITCEWGKEVFSEAKAQGLKTAFVSNGFASDKAVDYILPVLDACNVDLKSFNRETYRRATGGRLEPVLDTIRRFWNAGVWVEVITLVIPGLNDSDAELAAAAEFCASVSADMPWHATAFHPAYKMGGVNPTPAAMLVRAAELGAKAGLKYVYTGNIRGGSENTICHSCGAVLVTRAGFSVTGVKLSGAQCNVCGAAVAGRF